jgi:hypothetical protein
MSRVLGELQWKIAFVYVDDVITFSPTFEQHLQDINTVLDALRRANLSVKLSKCQFAKNQVQYFTSFGHRDTGKLTVPFDKLPFVCQG